MFKKTDTANSVGNETIIAQGVKVEGDFHSDGDVIIDGEVNGSIKTAKSLTIGETARIHANIVAASALIAGEVKGDIEALEKIELTSTSRVRGDITTGLIIVAPGAKVNGKITMGALGKAKKEGEGRGARGEEDNDETEE